MTPTSNNAKINKAKLCLSYGGTEKIMSNCFKMSPIVYSVGNNYIIAVPVNAPTLMWVKIGDECYYDHSNGILRSDVTVHKMTVPSEKLDASGKYTVCYREVMERKPYFSQVSDVYESQFEFSPVKDGRINIYHIADAHGDVMHTVAAAKCFASEYGAIDLLILNGDIVDHSGTIENFNAIHQISSDISGGSIPVICSRGNHDLRGVCAEKLEHYMPTADGGKTYFTFRQGKIWGMVLDCAEDKSDDHAEYGNCNCCHAFRIEQTEFIKRVIANADKEYAADGVECRLVIAHNPFTMSFPEPFDIEKELYAEWVRLLNENIKPNILLSGHTHSAKIIRPNDEDDAYGQHFATVIGAIQDKKRFGGCGIVLDGQGALVVMSDENEILSVEKLEF